MEAKAEDAGADLSLLMEVFEPIPNWRIDDYRGLQGNNHDKILKSVQELGQDSPYCKISDPVTGINALHACAFGPSVVVAE